MTAVADATTVIETLLGRTLTGPQLQNIGSRMVQADPFGLTRGVRNQPSGYFADPDNPTNEEKAQLILDSLLLTLKRWNRQAAQNAAKQTASADIIAAGDAAEVDLV